MKLRGDQVVFVVVLIVMFGFVAFSLFAWASESTTPTRTWGLFFAGLYVVALLLYAVYSILTEPARAKRHARRSVRKRTNEMAAWFLFAFAVLLTVFVLGFFAGSPLAMQALLAANLGLLGAWLLLLRKVRHLPGADKAPP